MAITQTYVDYGAGNDFGGTTFTDGAYTSATKVLAKNGAFTKTKVNHWLKLSSNAGGSIVAGYYKVATATDANSVILATDAGAGVDATDVKCTQATGTALLPFRSVQGALDIITRNATDGDQINIKAGTAQVNQASLTLVTYGTPAEGVPLILRGYTATANDGGIGAIDCGGFTMWAADNYGSIGLIDLHCYSFGNNNGINLGTGARNFMFRCEVDKGASSPGAKFLVCISGAYGVILNCYIHDAGTTGTGIFTNADRILFNYIVNCPTGINFNGAAWSGIGNIINVPSGGTGITATADGILILLNTIYSSVANTGTGINASSSAANTGAFVFNNVVEGFSGAGGKGLATTGDIWLAGYNAFFNNATPKSIGAEIFCDLTANDIALGASPFTAPASANFAVSTALKALGFPASFLGASTNTYIDIGAAQRQEPAGGAVSISPSLGSVGAA